MLAALAAGAWLHLAGREGDEQRLWTIALIAGGAPVIWRTIREAFSGHFATDLVAALAMMTAVAQRQPLAGLVVVLMQSGGEALEDYAEGRASGAVRALEQDAPRLAHRILPGPGSLAVEVAVESIAVDDLLLVRPGEMVPCDGDVVDGASHVDTSRLTGEPIPRRAEPGVHLASGTLNVDGPLVIRATATAGESQYARIVELVRSAQASKAPLQRLAERYAVWFTPVTLLVCAAAYLVSGDAGRVLSVLVVATPCPLILATPVAIIGGMNSAARRLIVVRHGGALEQLGGVTTAVFDKTGTLTVGMPSVSRVVPWNGVSTDDILRLAAAVEEGSGHLLARSVVRAAAEAGYAIEPAARVEEAAGRGVRGEVGGHRVCVGAPSFVADCGARLVAGAQSFDAASGLRAYVGVDGNVIGTIEFADRVRPALREFFDTLRSLGVKHVILLSGDTAAHTAAVAAAVGIGDARGELLPADKVEVVRRLVREGERVVMLGDGTNDAPALSAATVGVALAGHGGGITAEAADIVILSDDPTHLSEAIRISRRTLHIARQSIWVGLGLSGVAMLVAAAGYVPPVSGALLQEALDVAVILNALRTSR